jgi:two-component system, OmpR family, KDP operon response regulator KdpE
MYWSSARPNRPARYLAESIRNVPTVLIADDDPTLLEIVGTLLQASGYDVEITTSTTEALNRWPRSHPDLLIVDLHMPGDGMKLVKTISESTATPVIVLSADHQEEVKVAALDAGAEDYITKPFTAAELLARIRVALRRTAPANEPITLGPLTLSETARAATTRFGSVSLTPTEYELLKKLSVTEGFITTSDLLRDVWGPSYHTEHEYVRAYIRRLRNKLDNLGLPQAIESRPGLGYRLTLGGLGTPAS